MSHVASHLGTLEQRPDFFDVYLELAIEFGLPMRLGDSEGERIAGFPFRRLAAEEGAVFPDLVVVCPPGAQRRVERLLFDLPPGVTEVCLHPAVDNDELRAVSADWAGRVEDHAYLCRDPSLHDLVARAGAQLIGWRQLRELQRTGAAVGPGGLRLQNSVALATRSRPARKAGVAVASSSSSSLPGSPAVFIRPCMKATVGSSSPRAIATASA